MFSINLPPSSTTVTIWPRWQSLLVQSQPFFLVWGTTVIYIKPRLAFPPAAATPRPGSLCCQTPATWTDRLSRGSHPSPPTTRVLKVFKITWSLCACSWWRSLICGFPWESRSREQRGTRTGQPLGQTEQTLSGLFSFGDDWHRPDFPRKLLRFLLLNFFFYFPIFIVWLEWKRWHLAATFHRRYCYALVEGICFPSGETQRRCPCLQE